jgi:photosystem II stability/assembly factor-like uncharacterized protein
MGTMFEHLDDPAGEVEPGARELALVSRRAEKIRSRRRWAGMVGFCVLLLAASVGFFLARPSATAPSTSTAAYQFNLIQGDLPVGLPVPSTALVDVEFASPQAGFALAVHRSDVLLAASVDGGGTWQVRNDHLPPGLGSEDGYPGQFEFVGSTGYLWGARATNGAPLWVSHDAGATWEQADIGPYVLDASAIGPDVWALASTCPFTLTATTMATCPIGVEASLDGGVTWSALASPATVTAGGKSGLRPAELARITKTRAYVLTDGTTSATGSLGWQLSFTADAGATWTTRGLPCGADFSNGAEVAASSTDDLWLLCGGQASTGAQSKQLFRSDNGGVAWSLVASVTGLGSPPPTAMPPNPLPLTGYISPFTVGHRNLAVASPHTAWLYPSRAGLYSTSDGGSSWAQIPELAAAGFASGGPGNITFVSPTQGWICAYGVGVWHTTDGIHWQQLGTG